MPQLAPPPQAPSPLAQVPPTPADPTPPGRSDAPSHLPTGAGAASNPKLIETQPQPENKMEADDTASPNPQSAPASEEASPEDTPPAFSSSPSAHAAAPPQAREVAMAMEVVERDAAAIAESYASLFASLRVALSNVTSMSVENMQCLGDVVGRLQESALEASSKGNKYINSCLRLNEEIRGLESLAMQLKILRKNVDSLDLAVDRLLHIP